MKKTNEIYYPVDIDFANGEQLRGSEYEFSTLEKAEKFFKFVTKKDKFKGKKLDNVQLIKQHMSGEFEVLKSYFPPSK